MDLEIVITDSENIGFAILVALLDQDLAERYGELQKQYDRHNKLDFINDVVVLYRQGEPAACGAFKEFDRDSVEMKRVFVKKEYRGQGLSKLVIKQLEEMAKEKGYNSAVLETGVKQQEAICLYNNFGYEVTPNYGPYVGNSNSVCMKKQL